MKCWNFTLRALRLIILIPVFLVVGCSTYNTLTIQSEPSEADIFIKDNSTNSNWIPLGEKTPITLPWTRKDFYIKACKEGVTGSDSLFIHSIKRHELITLVLGNQAKKIMEVPEKIELIEKYGYIKLSSNEKDVAVYLDNELIGHIQGDAYAKKILSGSHNIMVKKQFFEPITIRINLKENDVLSYNFELVKAKSWKEEAPTESQIKQALGRLTVLTEDTDFRVYIDGQEKIPPFQLKNVPAGIYEIKIKKDTIEKFLKITISEDKEVVIDLAKEFYK